MNYTVTAYVFYLAISVALTVWVARTLHRNGRVFLVQAFRGSEEMADSVNHLLVVGFHLINVGFITATLSWGPKPEDLQAMVEFLSTKVGIALLVLGAMHFFNVFNFGRMRRKGLRPEPATAAFAAPLPPPLR